MTKGISLVTPTGGRKESLQRCVKYVERLIKPVDVPIEWIIVNDSEYQDSYKTKTKTRINDIDIYAVQPFHIWSPGKNTQALNLLEACKHINYDYVIFIEDDDWYSPNHLINLYENLSDVDLVGENPSRYYHVPSKSYRIMNNDRHTSLCQTGMKSTIIERLTRVCHRRPDLIDWHLWQTVCTKKVLETQNCVGMKGLPGRPGIGIGHTPQRSLQSWTKDSDLSVLSQWIGDDVKLYV